MKLKVKPVQAVPNEKEGNEAIIKKLTVEIEGVKQDITKLTNYLEDKIIERFYLVNAPYKDGDAVVALLSNKEVTGILEYVHDSFGAHFCIRPYKKDGDISNTHKYLYNGDKILRYLI